ncbi:MAG: hypothetical protein ABIT05_06490 [Chitinophagaceae bacterium]
MRKCLLQLISLFFVFLTVHGQNPEEALTRWSERSPIEKTYLHFDRDNYLAGETAWFKAYLYSDYQPDTISTSLYIELVNEGAVVISRKILPVFLGGTNGQFELPDSLSTGSYQVRAYSSTMLNGNPDFIYHRSLFINGKKTNATAVPKEKLTRLEFFPEGGNLVKGFLTTVAFKATDENGLPVDVSGQVKNEEGKELASLASFHDGMGLFEITPAANEKYFVLLNGDPTAKKYYLPEKADNGIALSIIPHPQGLFFEIHQRSTDPAFQAAYMIGQMQHHVVFRQDFKSAKEQVQGIINTKNLHSGILQITFFNKNGLPLAERLCFVNNKEYIQPAELIADTVNFSGKAKNHLTISLKDTVTGSFSVSITDPDYQLLPSRQENIYSGLLLTSDLKGYIHNPAYYFSADNDSAQMSLDLVMMTNGWRRFKWNELTKNGPPTVNNKDLSYITLAGRVSLRGTKKPFAENPLLLLIIGSDSTRTMQIVNTDKQGQFRLDSMMFFGTSRVLFSDIRGKKSQYIEVNLSADSLTRLFNLPLMEKLPPIISEAQLAGSQSKLAYDYDAIMKANGTMLQGITLKVKKKTLLEEMEEKYVSGMFSGDANKTIDLVNNKEADLYPTIFDYLLSKVPGIDVTNDGATYVVYYRQTASASSMGPIPMILYLNEIETDASVIGTIPADQVAMVKVFSSFAGAVGNGAGGVLAIYTKKDADITSLTSAADMLKYQGYSVVKEFYAPDYTVNKTARDKADNRITLDWRPDIFVNHINPRIPVTFYNNDRTKKFRVVVEGMTTDGKMIFIERIISSDSRRSF